MALAEKFSTAEPTTFGLPCGVAKLIEVLPPEELDAFQKTMQTPPGSPNRLSNRRIHSILLAEGYSTSFSSISLHRRRACRCFTGKSPKQAGDTA